MLLHSLLNTGELPCELFLKQNTLSSKALPLIQSPNCPNKKVMRGVPQTHLHWSGPAPVFGFLPWWNHPDAVKINHKVGRSKINHRAGRSATLRIEHQTCNLYPSDTHWVKITRMHRQQAARGLCLSGTLCLPQALRLQTQGQELLLQRAAWV